MMLEKSQTSGEFLNLSQAANCRSDMYNLLVIGFLDPTRELASGLVNGSFQSDVIETVKGLTEYCQYNGRNASVLILAADKLLNELFEKGTETLYHDLAIEYARLFIGPGQVVVSPYESINEASETHLPGLLMVGPTARKVLKSYQEAGLSMADGLNEPPDHIATELEFMYYLSKREAAAWESGDCEEARKWCGLQISFVKTHIGEWGIGFTKMVEKETREKFYSALSYLATSFLQLESGSKIEQRNEKQRAHPLEGTEFQ